MFRKLIIIITILSGLFLAVIWLDHWGYLKLVWCKTLPEIILSRNPSAQELFRINLQNRINELQQSMNDLRKYSDESQSRQKELESQLVKQLNGQRIDEHVVSEYLQEHPIVAVLIRSIDTATITRQEIQTKLIQNQKSLDALMARRLALDNGVSAITPDISPSDAIEADLSDIPSERQRHTEIMRRNGALISTTNERRIK